MECKIITNNIRCIDANSSASKRKGKFKSMHSGSKSESGAQYLGQTSTLLNEFLPMIKNANDGDILAELSSVGGVPQDQILSELENTYGIEPSQFVQMLRLAANELDNGLI